MSEFLPDPAAVELPPEPIKIVRALCARYAVPSKDVVSGVALRRSTMVRRMAIHDIKACYPGVSSSYLGDLLGIHRSAAQAALRKPRPVGPAVCNPDDLITEYVVTHRASRRIIMGGERDPFALSQRHGCIRYVAARCPELSLCDLARLFKLDHTTIMNALRRGARFRARDDARTVRAAA